jgi:hypothetical protein
MYGFRAPPSSIRHSQVCKRIDRACQQMLCSGSYFPAGAVCGIHDSPALGACLYNWSCQKQSLLYAFSATSKNLPQQLHCRYSLSNDLLEEASSSSAWGQQQIAAAVASPVGTASASQQAQRHLGTLGGAAKQQQYMEWQQGQVLGQSPGLSTAGSSWQAPRSPPILRADHLPSPSKTTSSTSAAHSSRTQPQSTDRGGGARQQQKGRQSHGRK